MAPRPRVRAPLTDQQRDLVEKNHALARSCAGKFVARMPANQGVDFDALHGAAGEMLVKAAQQFDPSKGNFVTYAWARMWHAMQDELRHQDVVSRAVRKQARQIEQARDELRGDLGRYPDDEEIAAKLKLTVDHVQTVRERVDVRPVTLDELIPETTVTRLNSICVGEKGFAAFENESFVADLLCRLPERERLVVTLYYFEEIKLREISEILGVSESRVCQLHTKALSRMRAWGQAAA